MPCGSLLLSFFLIVAQSSSQPCADAPSCKQAAIEAAAREDYEAFHDLAWRAAQKGPRNDPELMFLLARAQSLSGRPGDALVMLRRLAELGIATDARESEVFRKVRALPGWPDVEALLTAIPAKATTPEPHEAPAPAPVAPPSPKPKRTSAPEPPAPAPRPAPLANPTPGPPAPSDVDLVKGDTTLVLTELSLDPIGLAYDSASRRFVLGDRLANKLIVADDVFKHINDLIGATSAGFGQLGGVDIDGRRGDLWVASSTADGAASVHKLQLVSGRVLATITVPEDLRPATFSDIAVTDTAVLLVDSTGARLVRVSPGAARFDRPIPLDVPGPVSITPNGATVYVAHQEGLSRVDLGSGRTTRVRAADGIDLTGLRRIRWSRGTLVAIQVPAGGGPHRLVRIRLASGGTRAVAVQPMDTGQVSEGSALTIARDAVYYVARDREGLAIRRVPLERGPGIGDR